jgi:DNA repair protein RadD
VVILRPYQSSGIAQIREAFAQGFKAPLYVCPTGSGKTTVFAAIAESSEKRGKRVLILCHRVELVDQIVERLKQFNVTPEIIAAGYTRSAGRVRVSNRPVAVASVQTLIHRLDSYAAPTLTIADEAHHCAGGNTWSQILRRYPGTKILGTTASPIRGDGRGLAAHFDKLIMGPYPHELTEMGYLAKARVFSPPTVDTSGLHTRYGEYKTDESEALMDTPAITGDAFTHYRKHADGKSAIVFCTSVKHAHNVAEKFRKEGVSAIALDGGTDKELRRMAMKDFREDKIKVVTNCALFSEGLDIEGVHCGIFLRPTQSLGLYLQQCGRILRPSPGKEHAILLDHVGNCRMFGLPVEQREWTLTVDETKRKKKPAPGVRVCPKCFAASPARATVCVEADCRHIFEVKPRQNVEEREGELIELTAEQIAKKRERMAQGQATTLAQLENIARITGKKPGWAMHVMAGREAKKRRQA